MMRIIYSLIPQISILPKIQKCTTMMRVLAYGTTANLHDEYLRMSVQLIRKSLIKFVEGVISNFGDEYLRRSTGNGRIVPLHGPDNMLKEARIRQSSQKQQHLKIHGSDTLFFLELRVREMILMCLTNLLFLMIFWKVKY